MLTDLQHYILKKTKLNTDRPTALYTKKDKAK